MKRGDSCSDRRITGRARGIDRELIKHGYELPVPHLIRVCFADSWLFNSNGSIGMGILSGSTRDMPRRKWKLACFLFPLRRENRLFCLFGSEKSLVSLKHNGSKRVKFQRSEGFLSWFMARNCASSLRVVKILRVKWFENSFGGAEIISDMCGSDSSWSTSWATGFSFGGFESNMITGVLLQSWYTLSSGYPKRLFVRVWCSGNVNSCSATAEYEALRKYLAWSWRLFWEISHWGLFRVLGDICSLRK